MTKLTTVGTKKAVEPEIVNSGILPSAKKQGNFDLVAAGVCPHCDGKLGDEIRGKGIGVTRACESCRHTWYLNKKIRTCKCLTCSGAKRNSTERKIANRIGNQSDKKGGGRFWIRTRDPSLIRIGESVSKNAQPRRYLDAWYTEQQLRGIADITLYGYRQKVESLLNECTTPSEFDIKDFLLRKQEGGYYSGTIANYVKAFRSFFGYLYTRGLYDFDTGYLKLPKIHHKERRVPTDEDIRKLLSVLEKEEDNIAFLLLVDCGLRIRELATIKMKNISIDEASILINGKGGKARTVYLSEMTHNHLREYVKTCQSEYLFPSTRADATIPHRRNRYFQEHLAELCEKAGIERITPHQLRHYFATHTLSNGADVKAVSEMLGHADVGVTLKIYHHVNAKSIRQMHLEYSPLSDLKIIEGVNQFRKHSATGYRTPAREAILSEITT